MSVIGVYVYWDASPDSTVNDYRIYCGTSPGVYDVPNSPINTGNVLQYVYPVPGPGRYYFAISAISTVTGETAKGTEFSVLVNEPAGVITHLVRRQVVI